MKGKSRIFLTLLLSFLFVTSCASKPVSDPYLSLEDVYQIYVKNVSSNGQTPSSYKDWLAIIKGEKGDPGDNGKDGLDGTKILIGNNDPANDYGNEGDSYINTSSWDFFIKENGAWVKKGSVKGDQGDPGEAGDPGNPGSDGKSAYEIYVQEHPEYTGTEEEWIDDLVNGRFGEQEYHTVTFNTGSETFTYPVLHGGYVHNPGDPTKEGYNFLYWEDENLDKWVFDRYTVNKDLTLNAVWEEIIPDEPDVEFFSVSPSSMTLNAGESEQINAIIVPSSIELTFHSMDPSVATVDSDGLVTGVGEGLTTISVSYTNKGETRVSTVFVRVYDVDVTVPIEQYSQPGHLYVHYLRTSDRNYDRWGFWAWQSYPREIEGSLWGATASYIGTTTLKPMSYGYMSRSDVGLGADGTYCDEHGQIIDVDLTADVKGSRTGVSAPLVDWDSSSFDKASIGFLIVDQSTMGGSGHWASDGGAETFIEELGTILPDGRDSFLHIYCVEGNVGGYTYESGSVLPANPTETDYTGIYRTQNNVTLGYDKYPSGISTSNLFLMDRPGAGYDIFVPSFADSDGDGFGDIRGIINKLSYINDLGAKALRLSNLCLSDDYEGVAIRDHFSIDPRYGDEADLTELITAAHNLGMKVVLSLNFFLMSKRSDIFKKSEFAEVESVDGKIVEYRNMFHWRYKGDKTKVWDGVETSYGSNPNYVAVSVENNDSYQQYKSSNYYYLHYNGYPRLNYSAQVTRDYTKDACKYWLSLGADGLCMMDYKNVYTLNTLDDYTINKDYIIYDVFYSTQWNPELEMQQTIQNDFSIDRDVLINCWKEIVGDVKVAYPDILFMGDYFDGWDQRMAPQYKAFDSMSDYPTYYKLYETPQYGGIGIVGSNLKPGLDYYREQRNNCINGAFTSNKDLLRLLNHTQGNSNVTINSSNSASALRYARYMAAAAILLPGCSWVYYGDELGMSSNTTDSCSSDHEMYRSRIYRQPMKWGNTLGEDMVPNYSISSALPNDLPVEWDNYNKTIATPSVQAADSNSIYNLYKAAIAAKNSPYYPTYGYINNHWMEGSNQEILGLDITDGTRRVYVFINNTSSSVTVPISEQGTVIGGSVGFGANTIPAYGFLVVNRA